MSKKRYIVCVNNPKDQQDQAFLTYIKNSGFSWWHYLSNTWLIIDSSGNSTVADIRTKVMEYYPQETNMVFQLNEGEGTWSGFGPKSDKANMFTWINDYWK